MSFVEELAPPISIATRYCFTLSIDLNDQKWRLRHDIYQINGNENVKIYGMMAIPTVSEAHIPILYATSNNNLQVFINIWKPSIVIIPLLFE